jgi:signal recognition particle subunit SRP54
MFESLSDRIDGAIKTLKGEGRISEINVAATVKEIRRALVDADVNYKIAKEFTDKVKDKAMGEKVLTVVSPGQLMTKIVFDELTQLMGAEKSEINLKGSPAVILLSGLQGSGKTTFAAKLASYLKTKRGRQPMLVACDIYRPAAIEQLKILGEQIGVPVYTEEGNQNPVQIASNAIKEAKIKEYDTVIVDTAGRLAIDEEMMKEIEKVKNSIQPGETLFVVDSMTGQDAVNTSKTFNERLNFDGVVLTKLDGTAKGGVAVAIAHDLKLPIRYAGVGEGIPRSLHSDFVCTAPRMQTWRFFPI